MKRTKKTRRILTEQDKFFAAEAYALGYGIDKIAEELDVDRKEISKILSARGITEESRGRHMIPLSIIHKKIMEVQL